MKQAAFLESLIAIFDQSVIAYRQYLQGGKTFQLAQELRLYNGKALELLEENRSSLPGDLREDIQALVIHYTEWSTKWEKLAAERQFQPGDIFVFANDTTFPKKAAQNLERIYKDLILQKVTQQKN